MVLHSIGNECVPLCDFLFLFHQTGEQTAVQALQQALKDLKELCDAIASKYDQKLAAYENMQAQK
jgi:hypothetical protein